jgi:hypothetical protein
VRPPGRPVGHCSDQFVSFLLGLDSDVQSLQVNNEGVFPFVCCRRSQRSSPSSFGNDVLFAVASMLLIFRWTSIEQGLVLQMPVQVQGLSWAFLEP